MKIGRSLSDLAREIERQATVKRDLIAPSPAISMVVTDSQHVRPGTALTVGTNGSANTFGINSLAHNQIAAYVGIPSKYYDRMAVEAPNLLARNVNEWLNRSTNEKRLVRVLDDTVRALLSDGYRPLDNYDLATAVLPVLSGMSLEVVSCELTERRLYIKCVDQRINRDIPKGARMGDGSHHIFDTLAPAIIISNSEVGAGTLSVETGIWTKACTNLAVFAQDSMKRRHVGARHALTDEDSIRELLSDETKRLTDQAIWAQVGDVVKGAFDEVRFDARVQKIRGTTERKIDGDPLKVIEVTARKFGLNDTEKAGVLRHLIEGGSLTQYGVFNAITRTAEDCPAYDRAYELERMGGQIIDLAPNEWKLISKADDVAAPIAA
jgi:hypothetical protein